MKASFLAPLQGYLAMNTQPSSQKWHNIQVTRKYNCSLELHFPMFQPQTLEFLTNNVRFFDAGIVVFDMDCVKTPATKGGLNSTYKVYTMNCES